MKTVVWGKGFEECVKKKRWRYGLPTRSIGFGSDFVDLPDSKQVVDHIIQKILPEGYEITKLNDVYYKVVVAEYKSLEKQYPPKTQSIVMAAPPFSLTKEQKEARKRFCEESRKKYKEIYKKIKSGKYPKLKNCEQLIFELKIYGYEVSEKDFCINKL